MGIDGAVGVEWSQNLRGCWTGGTYHCEETNSARAQTDTDTDTDTQREREREREKERKRERDTQTQRLNTANYQIFAVVEKENFPICGKLSHAIKRRSMSLRHTRRRLLLIGSVRVAHFEGLEAELCALRTKSHGGVLIRAMSRDRVLIRAMSRGRVLIRAMSRGRVLIWTMSHGRVLIWTMSRGRVLIWTMSRGRVLKARGSVLRRCKMTRKTSVTPRLAPTSEMERHVRDLRVAERALIHRRRPNGGACMLRARKSR
jgi:hypothetical protein